ncbi:MAG: two-component system sensor histidine kinase NtrB [Terriglobia bacterium]
MLVGLLGVGFYILHKVFQQQRTELDLKSKSPRVENDATFAMATMQGVIAKMKEQERELTGLRVAAEQRARESSRISENIIREMPSGLMVFNREGFITTANPAVRTLLGIDTWSRRRYPEILGAESLLAAHIRECLETGKTTTRETIEYTTPQGEVKFLGMSLSSFHGTGGEVDGAVCLLSDLTETRQLQEQIRLKEHLAALGAMSAGIAHEFKNSLATISGYAQMLRDGNLTEPDREHAEKIVLEIRSLTRVVMDFLAVSKPLQLTASQVNPKDLLIHSMEDLQRVADFQRVMMNLEGEFALVEGDELLLKQAFSNLLRNACEAQWPGKVSGRIVVRGEMLRQGEKDHLKILISDGGKGIPLTDRDKIFVPFFTTKASGSGLGLALVQKIILSHGGLVTLESSSSQGSTFAVILPLRHEAATQKSPG